SESVFGYVSVNRLRRLQLGLLSISQSCWLPPSSETEGRSRTGLRQRARRLTQGIRRNEPLIEATCGVVSAELGVPDRPGEGCEEGDKRLLLLAGQMERAELWIEVGVGAAAAIIKIDHVQQRRQATVVH